jgi:hypothetical protein
MTGEAFICLRGRPPAPSRAQRELRPGDAVDVRLDDVTTWRTRARSAPWRISGGRWVIAVVGRTGGFALERVTPVTRQLGLPIGGAP